MGDEYTPTTRTYGHGSITFTHYPSSQRIAVVQTGENAVMDTSDLYRFMEDAGLLASVERAAAEKALEGAAEDVEGIKNAARDGMNKFGPYPWHAAEGVADWLRARAVAAWLKGQGDTNHQNTVRYENLDPEVEKSFRIVQGVLGGLDSGEIVSEPAISALAAEVSTDLSTLTDYLRENRIRITYLNPNSGTAHERLDGSA